MKARVAFIGAGYMAAEHAKVYASLDTAVLVGVCSRSKERAIAFAGAFGLPLATDSIDELLEEARPDLTVVAVPELSVRDVCVNALRFPSKLLVEKPVGRNLSEAEYILECAGSRAGDIRVALNRRYYASTAAAARGLQNDQGPRVIHIQDQEDLERAAAGGQPREVLENWMYANSIHLIDYFSVFGRGKADVVTRLGNWTFENPEAFSAILDFDSGDRGIYTALWNMPGPWSVSISTASQRWELRPLEVAASQKRGERKIVEEPRDAWDTEFKPGLRRMADDAIAFATRRPTMLPDLRESVKTMRLIHAIYGC
ncbi:MAG: Gfo/Idh/MocA family oxidoreductase [Leptospirales bacterium]|nr:Gfo/Idh/MocA family oxidoreductase [Leptospirales bacterium]